MSFRPKSKRLATIEAIRTLGYTRDQAARLLSKRKDRITKMDLNMRVSLVMPFEFQCKDDNQAEVKAAGWVTRGYVAFPVGRPAVNWLGRPKLDQKGRQKTQWYCRVEGQHE